MVRTTFGVLSIVILGAAGVLGSGPSESKKTADDLPPLNRKVVDFARERLGEKVGNGECTALASAALRSAGARHFGFHGNGGDYIWGRPIESFKDAMPGDIVQFRDAVFRGKARLSGKRTLTWHQEYPHHTALISEVRDGGKTVVLLHQNVGPDGASREQKQVVSETTLRVDGLQKGGRLWIYRPIDDGATPEQP